MRKLLYTVGKAKRVAFQFSDKPSLANQSPTILALHGAGGHPLLFHRVSGIDRASRFADVLYLAAERHGRLSRWNWENLDDHDFLMKVIHGLLSKGKTPENIYIFGMSNGGCLANLFGFTCGINLGGIASVCSAMPIHNEEIWGQNNNQQPHRIFLANALHDPIMPYYGGRTESDLSHDVLSHDETIKQWQMSMSCHQKSLSESASATRCTALKNVKCQLFASDRSKEILSITSNSSQHTWQLNAKEQVEKPLARGFRRRWSSTQQQGLASEPSMSELISQFMFSH